MIIKAIIFDLGKVVFDLSFEKAFEYWSKATGVELAEIRNRFKFDEVHEKFETGELTAREFRKIISFQLSLSLDDKTFDEGWCNIYLDTHKKIDDLLPELKSKYRLAALTNSNEIHEPIWKNRYAKTLQVFEKIFSSHLIKARKPDEKAFKMVLEYLKLEPQQTIFLDDNIENINGAEKMGINSILVTSPEQMIRDLKILLRD